MPFDGTPLSVEEGVVAKSTLVAQQRAARQLIDKHAPERIVVLGGDCLVDPALFRAQLMQNPAGVDPSLDGVARGTLSMAQVIALLNVVAQVADVVGISIAEHLPWDAINLQQMLKQLPLIGEPR